jgi:hypothetical protein
MKFRERWRAIPWDARMGYSAFAGFLAWLAFCVVASPLGVCLAPWCVVYPLLAVVVLVLAVRLAFCTGRWGRVLPLLLAAGCLATLLEAPWRTVCLDLHLVSRVYLAGGPKVINDWAQGLLREHGDGTDVEGEQVPEDVRTYLSGYVIVGNTPWSDLVRVQIELGGGFYHYGVVVYPTSDAPPAEWWQHLLDWPPEVVIYHE